MQSLRSRLVDVALRVSRPYSRGAASTADAGDDAEALAAAVAARRRPDRHEPPRSLRRRWDHVEVDVDGFALHRFVDADTPRRRVLLYLHGGAYVVGPLALQWTTASKIARRNECDFALLDYPKAPEHQVDTAVAVTAMAFEELARRYGAENIVVAGDSAGGGLALALMMHLRDESGPQPAAAILISPWVDAAMDNPEIASLTALDHMLTVDGLLRDATLYAGERSLEDPAVSPLRGDLTGLAPIHVFVGDHEIFFPDDRALVERAGASGVRARLYVVPYGQHVGVLFPTPEGARARAQIDRILSDLRSPDLVT